MNQDDLLGKIQRFLDESIRYNLTGSEKLANELLFDVQENQYTFIVVGEFSTGKSSFVNALIGQPLLPVGITPTTSTINILSHGEPATNVKYKDGKVESIQAEQLKQYIASTITDVAAIDYITIQQPLKLLENNVILIDTPGLNDLNEARVDITYNYIPRSDVVLFMLDCRLPLRKSEFSYITDALLTNGLDRIIFIANFADDVPEADLDGIVNKIQRQLVEALPISEVTVIPFSTHEALEGVRVEDLELLEISGFNRLVEKIQQLCETGSRTREKAMRLAYRYHVLEKTFIAELEQYKELLQQSEQELNHYLESIQKWEENQIEFLMQLDDYYAERIFEFQKITNKSVEKFFIDLQEELMQKVDLYQGNNIQHYFEQELPAYIKNRMKQWIEQYNPKIHILLSKLEMALADALEIQFNEKIRFSQLTKDHPSNQEHTKVIIRVQKPFDATVTSGLLVGGTGAIFLMLGGSILLPIIGMAGLPYIQKVMQEKNLKRVKPQVKVDLQAQLLEMEHQFVREIEQYIQASGDMIYKETRVIFDRKVQQQEELVRKQLMELKTGQKNQQQKIEKINQLVLQIG